MRQMLELNHVREDDESKRVSQKKAPLILDGNGIVAPVCSLDVFKHALDVSVPQVHELEDVISST